MLAVWHILVKQLHAPQVNVSAFQISVHAHRQVEIADEEHLQKLMEYAFFFALLGSGGLLQRLR